MRIWVDDIRDPKEWLPHISWFRGRDLNELSEWIWIKTAQAAIALLDSENIVEASLDFDLGDLDEAGDGYMVATWVEEANAWKTAQAASDNLNSGTDPDPVAMQTLANLPGGGKVRI